MVARKRTEVEVDAVDRGLVELEVAGVQHVARRALQKHAHGAGDRMVHGEKLRREAAHLHLLAGLDFNELGVLDTVLGELSLDEAERELGRIDGNRAIEVFQEVRNRARVVLVAVRDDDTAQLVGMLKHIGVVRQDKVDAGMIVVGEHKARVIDDHVVSAFEHGHVLANGVKAAKRDDLQLGLGVLARARRTLLLSGLALLLSAVARFPALGKLGAFMLELHMLVCLGFLSPLCDTVVGLPRS